MLNKEQLDCLKKNLMDIAFEFTKHYISDIVYCFNAIDRGLDENKKYYFLSRECGVEFGTKDTHTIKYYNENNLSKPNCTDIKAYEIDVYSLSLIDVDSLGHYSDLRKNGVIKEIVKIS